MNLKTIGKQSPGERVSPPAPVAGEFGYQKVTNPRECGRRGMRPWGGDGAGPTQAAGDAIHTQSGEHREKPGKGCGYCGKDVPCDSSCREIIPQKPQILLYCFQPYQVE